MIRINKHRLLVFATFLIIFIIGMGVVGDYIKFIDDGPQRRHSLVSYKYINDVLFGRDIPQLAKINDFEDYHGKNYGTAVQMPMVFIEDLYDFDPPFDKWRMRHTINFIYFFFALICLFFICRILFEPLIKNPKKTNLVSLAGMLMMFLFPRFFGSSFDNIKDLVFVSFFTMALLFMILFLKKKRSLVFCILFCVFCALATNVRMAGLMLIPSVLVFMLVEDVVKRKWDNEFESNVGKSGKLWPYLLVVFGFALVFFIITPALWADPIRNLYTMLNTAADFSGWNSVMLFNGNWITQAEMPWYYLPVWMLITIPVYILFFFAVGVILLVKGAITKGIKGFVEERYFWLIFLLLLIPMLLQMTGKISIYLDWHHVYFIFVPLLLIAVYGAVGLDSGIKRKTSNKLINMIVPCILIAGLLVSGIRVAVNHPHQEMLFNAIGTPMGENFDHSTRSTIAKGVAQFILDNYGGNEIIIVGDVAFLDIGIKLAKGSEEDKQKILISEGDFETADFYLYSYRLPALSEEKLNSYSEVFTIKVDGAVRIASLYINVESSLYK